MKCVKKNTTMIKKEAQKETTEIKNNQSSYQHRYHQYYLIVLIFLTFLHRHQHQQLKHGHPFQEGLVQPMLKNKELKIFNIILNKSQHI